MMFTKRRSRRSGWSYDRVRAIIEHYESQSDEEAIAEDEAAFESSGFANVSVPHELLPQVRKLLADHDGAKTSK